MARLSFNMARPRVLRALRGSAVRLHAAPPMPGPARGAGIPVLREPFRSCCGQVPHPRHGRRGALRAAPIPRVIIRRPCAPRLRAPRPASAGRGNPPRPPVTGRSLPPLKERAWKCGKIPRKKNGKKSEKFLKKNKKSVDTK